MKNHLYPCRNAKTFSGNSFSWQETIKWYFENASKAPTLFMLYTENFVTMWMKVSETTIKDPPMVLQFGVTGQMVIDHPSSVLFKSSLREQRNSKIRYDFCVPRSCRIATFCIDISPVSHWRRKYICIIASYMHLHRWTWESGEAGGRTSIWKRSVRCSIIWCISRLCGKRMQDYWECKLFMTPCGKFINCSLISFVLGFS